MNPINSNISAQQGNESLPEGSHQPSPLAEEQLKRAQNQVQLAKEEIQSNQGNESLPEASQQPSPFIEEQFQRAQNQVQLAQQQTQAQQNTSLTG
ncbi:MAG TPA: hypothetical protein VJR94_08945 [Candidatus Nitrosocosmicus sp.]|nr:hypothetical protein [Candidatus Nitrosocosmicus sp.]